MDLQGEVSLTQCEEEMLSFAQLQEDEEDELSLCSAEEPNEIITLTDCKGQCGFKNLILQQIL